MQTTTPLAPAKRERLSFVRLNRNKFRTLVERTLSFEAFANLHKHLHCSKPRITNILNHPATATRPQLHQLAKLLGVDAYSLQHQYGVASMYAKLMPKHNNCGKFQNIN